MGTSLFFRRRLSAFVHLFVFVLFTLISVVSGPSTPVESKQAPESGADTQHDQGVISIGSAFFGYRSFKSLLPGA